MNTFGKFDLLEEVGKGPTGAVYKASDPLIGRIVALKTLNTELFNDPDVLKRFYAEARSAGRLVHANIVTLYEIGRVGDVPFIAMQFLKGESLDKIIARKPSLTLSQKVDFITCVCRALEYAHKQSPPVVHGDIKPSNVVVTSEGIIVVVDFGIGRLREGTRSDSSGMFAGSLGYMSPQLLRNGPADARSDIWATGVMFYELLAYRRPFDGDIGALMPSVIQDEPRSLAEVLPEIPSDVQAVVERMLAKEIEARYHTTEEVLKELEPIWKRLREAESPKMFGHTTRVVDEPHRDQQFAAVKTLLSQARALELEKREVHDQEAAKLELSRRVAEIKSKLAKDRQRLTLAAVGPDAEITQLLHKAESKYVQHTAAEGPEPPALKEMPQGQEVTPILAAPRPSDHVQKKAPLAPDSRVPTEVKAIPSGACSNCGGQVTQGERYCSNCGTRLEELGAIGARSAAEGQSMLPRPASSTGTWRAPSAPAPAKRDEVPKIAWLNRLIERIKWQKSVRAPVLSADAVHFSVTSSSVVVPDTVFLINVWAHLETQRKEVIRRAEEAAQSSEIFVQSKGPVEVTRGTILSVRLNMEDLFVEDPEDRIRWEGEIGNATFSVKVPKTAQNGPRKGLLKVYAHGVEVAKIHFLVRGW